MSTDLARRKARSYRRRADLWERYPGWMTAAWLVLMAANASRLYRAARTCVAAYRLDRERQAKVAEVDAKLAHAMADLRREYAPTEWAGDLLRTAADAEDREESDDA